MKESNDLGVLAQLLQGGGASPVVTASASSSTIYDVHYRVVVNACAFEIHGRTDTQGHRRISANRLKLLQFVAIRPWLLPGMREWADAKGTAQQSLLTQRFRRGFLGDVVHERVIDLLIAHGALTRGGVFLVSGESSTTFSKLCADLARDELFQDERDTLQELLAVRITNAMLEGW